MRTIATIVFGDPNWGPPILGDSHWLDKASRGALETKQWYMWGSGLTDL